MMVYHQKVHELLGQFEIATNSQVPRLENSNADALARLATILVDNLLKTMPVEVLETLSISKIKQVAQVDATPSWIDPFISYLCDDVLLDDRDQVRSLGF